MIDVVKSPGSISMASAPAPSFVEWSPVLAGGAMAAALSFVLLTFGSAIGLSFVSPWKDAGVSGKVIASFAVFWAMSQQIGAAMAGAYIAGRMRTQWSETISDEVEFRDGLHGGLVWALGVVITAAFLMSAAGSAVRTGSEVAGRVVSTANADPLAYQIDSLLRAAPRSATQTATTTPNSDLRSEMLRTFARAVSTGTLASDDRSYLVGVVSQRTGLPQQDAEKRVNDAYADASRVAKEAAETARRSAILIGLVTAASLVISLGAAWWAAIKGGSHRDNSIPARFNLPMSRRPVA